MQWVFEHEDDFTLVTLAAPPVQSAADRAVRFSGIAGAVGICRTESVDFMQKIPYRHAYGTLIGVHG